MKVPIAIVLLLYICTLSGVYANCEPQNLFYEKDVPLAFNIRSYETYTSFPGSAMGHCSAKCFDDLDCQAMEICVTGGEEHCRLVRGWEPTFVAPDNGASCQQYKVMVNSTCDPGQYYDRSTGQCVTQELCDFETTTETSCFLLEDADDIFNWSRKSGSTSSVSTGPSTARAGMYYKYIETSSPRVTGDSAKLVSNRTFEEKTYCLSLYYHMYGSTIGTLRIQTRKGNDTSVTHWELSGDQGNAWHSLDKLSLPLDNSTQIIIEGVRGTNFYSDISVDYVVLWPFACP